MLKTILLFMVLDFSVFTVKAEQKISKISGKLIIFHAGSLSMPFKQICEEFNKCYPKVRVFREAAGSRTCARKITDLNMPCDVMASADCAVINTMLIPEHAKWNLKFASNEMVIAFNKDSRRVSEINKDNWYTILTDKDVSFGRSDPNSDPCGYRSVLIVKLAEKFYNVPNLARRILAKDQRYIRPKEVDLLALLEMSELDYIFIYRSVAVQHKLGHLVLPDEINLRKVEFSDFYKKASVRLVGREPGTSVIRFGEPIIYSVTVPENAPNRKLALTFLMFLLDENKGGAILERNGQDFIVPLPAGTFEKIPDSLKQFALRAEKEG